MDAQLMKLCLIEQKYVSNLFQSFNGTNENLKVAKLQSKLAEMKAKLEQQRRTEEMLKTQVTSCQEELKHEKKLSETREADFLKERKTQITKSQVLLDFAEAEAKPDYGIKGLKVVLDENFKNYKPDIQQLEVRRTLLLEEIEKLKKLEEEAMIVKCEAENLMAPTH